MLELVLLGNPVLILDGLEVRAKTRKALVLLAVLALEGRVSRERLAVLLWADSPDAKNSLRNALSSLRYSFGAHVQSDRSSVWLSDFVCDALGVLQGSLEAALQYRADFLDAIHLPDAPEAEEWLEITREQLRVAALHLLEVAVPSEGILEQWCRLEPLSEVAHLRFVQWLAADGQRTRALQVFTGFKTKLATDLGLQPTPEMLALADSLQLEPSAKSGRVPSLPSLLLESRLVGRVSEFQRLVAAFHSTAQLLPRVMVLSGEPGIGKTRLAQEFLAWASARGATILSARAFEGGALAYQCITDALRRVPNLEGLLSPVWLAELARLLPELLEVPNLPAPVSDEALGRSRVFEAVIKLSQKLGHLIWFLDDAQWADAASLEMLLFVLRRAAIDRTPILLVSTVRSEALEQIENWLNNLARDVTVEPLALGTFSKDETLRLLEDMGVPPAALLDWLFSETSGQPLYIAETLRSLAENGVLLAERDGWKVHFADQPQTAPGVRTVIEARFARLSHTARILLEVGAVLGQGFVFSDAARVAQIPENELLLALEECLRARVLLELPATDLQATKYTFSHDKLRETALQRLSAPRLQALQSLALTRVHGSAAQRATHAIGARAWLEAVRFSVEAADAASLNYAWRDALTHLETARRILVERPDGVPHGLGLGSVELAELFGNTAQLHVTLNMFEANSTLANETIALARAIPDVNLEAHGLMFLADTLGWQKPDQARALQLQAQELFKTTGDQRALFELKLLWIGIEQRPRKDHAAFFTEFEALLPEAKVLSLDTYTSVLATIASTRQAWGYWHEAAQNWDDILASSISICPNDFRAYRLENLGFCQTNLGQLDSAIQNTREAFSMKQAIDDNPAFTGMAAVYLAYALLERGETEHASTLCLQTYACRVTALPRMAAEFCFALGFVYFEQAEFVLARDVILEAQQRIQALEPKEYEIIGDTYNDYLESFLCATNAKLGNWETAAQHALKALEIRERTHNWRGIHAPKVRHWLEVQALRHSGADKKADFIISRLAEFVQVGEPLEVNLALCQKRKLEIPDTWVLRQKWLETDL